MTSRTQPRTAPGWALPFLAALVAVLATILSSATASAATHGTAETRVRASTVEVEVPVGPPESVSAGERLGNDPGDVVLVVATGVAAKSVDDVLGGLAKGKQSGFKTVGSDAELQGVYNTLSRGGTPVEVPGYKGSWVERPDGIRIGLRDASKTGGRTIDVRYPDGTIRKVHIE